MTTAYEAGQIPVITPGHRCRIAREALGLDQTQLAKLMGISRTSVSNVELGKHEPRKIVLNAWAMATGVPVSWLETGEAPPSGNEPKGQNGAPGQDRTDDLSLTRTVLYRLPKRAVCRPGHRNLPVRATSRMAA